MDRETRSWLVGVGFESDGAPVLVEKLTLSAAQKRELAGLTGLVMASTVFFLTPLVLSAPEPAMEMVPLERTAVTLAVSVAAQATAPAPAPAAVFSRGRNRAAAPYAPGGSRVRAAAPLAPPRAVLSTVSITPVNASAGRATTAKPKKTSNGVMGVLVGSGRYRVQPFPSPPSV